MSNQIKKSYFLELFNNGMKVEDMAKSIESKTGIPTNVNDVRKIAKSFNINLKTKPRKNKFQLVNDVEIEHEQVPFSNSESNLDEGYSNMDNKVVIK